jgi:serine/threonine-protein kinase HipA
MALIGKNKHYKWCEGSRAYIIETAKNSGYSIQIAQQLLDEMLSQVDEVIATVTNMLPKGFPENIYVPIFAGMRFDLPLVA